jgi:hypothetical protein
MRNYFLIILSLNIYSIFYSQVSAITQDGEKVILYNDYTWRYADGNHVQNDKSDIRKIEVDSYGMVKVEFSVKGERIVFYDGKLFFNNIGQTRLEYHNNSFFAKTIGKIKQADFGDLSIEFEYHQNFIYDKSEGKIKSIEFGDEKLSFEYHENSFFKYSVGKIKSISKDRQTVNFEYHQNSIYPENEGKLKEIKGEIPGIRIRYLD